jgi:hypothetical protein
LHFSAASKATAVKLPLMFDGSSLSYQGEKIDIRNKYTGVPGLDTLLSFLVVVFLNGPSGMCMLSGYDRVWHCYVPYLRSSLTRDRMDSWHTTLSS